MLVVFGGTLSARLLGAKRFLLRDILPSGKFKKCLQLLAICIFLSSASRKTNLITVRALKKGNTRMLANARKNHLFLLILIVMIIITITINNN